MKDIRFIVALWIALTTVPAPAQDLTITNVTVVDTRNGTLYTHQNVTIRDGRITAVDTSAPSSGVQTLNGTGKYLVPGLWDFVTHLSWVRASALPALVANGVTAVRDQGGDFAETAVWAQSIRSGQLIGPTIFQVGPMLNGKSFNRYQFPIENAEQARLAVRLLKFEGVDGLEIERRLSRDAYIALMNEAKASALLVGGKIPVEISAVDASNAGQATIDNLETLYDGVFAGAHKDNLIAGIDAFLAPAGDGEHVFAVFAQNGTAVTPSLHAVAYALEHNEPDAPRDAKYRYVAQSQQHSVKPVPPSELATFRAMLPRLLTTTEHLQKAGVTLLAGTDLAGDRIPGFSLHDELDLLAKAGLSPLEVLQTATLNPAKVMHRLGDYGTVEPGRVADLLLLNADPTHSEKALRDIAAVVLHGQLMQKADLEKCLDKAATMAEQN